MPLISVIIPNYNNENYIGEAIESILNQTHKNLELVVVDDCSSDNSINVIKGYKDNRIIFLQNDSNSGSSFSRNRGIKTAKGKYIACMDSDDIALPKRLEKQIDFMEKNPDIGVCGTNFYKIKMDKLTKQIWTKCQKHNTIKSSLIFSCPMLHPSVVMKADILKGNKLFYNTDVKGAEDYELWAKLIQITKFHNIQEPLMQYRIHSNQVSVVIKEKQKNELRETRNEIFKKIGIVLSEDELIFHNDLCLSWDENFIIHNSQTYKKINSWLAYINSKNKESGCFFDPDSLSETFCMKWLNIIKLSTDKCFLALYFFFMSNIPIKHKFTSCLKKLIELSNRKIDEITA